MVAVILSILSTVGLIAGVAIKSHGEVKGVAKVCTMGNIIIILSSISFILAFTLNCK